MIAFPTFATWVELTFPAWSRPSSYGTDWSAARISFVEYENSSTAGIRERRESYPRGKISISEFKIAEAEADVCQSEEARARTFSAHLDFFIRNGASRRVSSRWPWAKRFDIFAFHRMFARLVKKRETGQDSVRLASDVH